MTTEAQIKEIAETWLPIAQVANLIGKTSRMIRLNCARDIYKWKKERGNGGMQYLIALSSLSKIQQANYLQSNVSEKKIDNTSDSFESEVETLSKAPEYSRKKAQRDLSLIELCKGLKGSSLKEFIGSYNKKHPDKTTSYQSIMRKRKEFSEGGLPALLGKWGVARAGQSKVPNDLYEIFESCYLKEGSPSALSCWKITLGKATELKYDTTQFPSHSTFLRQLQRKVPQAAIYAARHGMAAADRRYGFYIKRDKSDLLAGGCWFSDHAQLDVAVSCKVNGQDKVVFPWVTVWRDFKSGKWVGWDLHAEDPSSDFIFISFYRAAIKYGIPSVVYIDNGKDYRCKDFAGGRRPRLRANVDKATVVSLTGLLGIKTIFAWPYNAQSKAVERDFLRNKEWFSKHLPGYRGGNVVERPEGLKSEISRKQILTIEELDTLLTDYIEKVAMQSPVNGRYPQEIWDAEYQTAIEQQVVRHLSKTALMLFCTRTSSVKQIGRRGFRDNSLEVDYYNNWMEGQKGRKVYLRRDPKAMQEAWVFDALSDEYIGQAYLLREVSAIAQSDIQLSELKSQISIKKTARKLMRIASKPGSKMTASEKFAAMAVGQRVMNEEQGYVASNAQEVLPPIHATKMDHVAAQKKRNEMDGTQDISIMTRKLKSEPSKKKLFAWEHERDEWEIQQADQTRKAM